MKILYYAQLKKKENWSITRKISTLIAKCQRVLMKQLGQNSASLFWTNFSQSFVFSTNLNY